MQGYCRETVDLDADANNGSHQEPHGVVADPRKVEGDLLPKVGPEGMKRDSLVSAPFEQS